jgi:archaellin
VTLCRYHEWQESICQRDEVGSRRPPYVEAMQATVIDQRGVTGLEVAIVLIAFVVVSTVFAFATLSAGLASSDQAESTFSASLAEAGGSLELRSGVKLETTLTTKALTTVTAEAVGNGDGVDTTFSLVSTPVLSMSETVFVGGAAKARGTDYSVNYDTGVITFTAAPASDVAITAYYRHGHDFVGTGDGSSSEFVLSVVPVIPGNGVVVYLDGSARTLGTDYVLDHDTGVLSFINTPDTGARLGATYTSYTIGNVVLTLSNALGGEPIDMTGGKTIMSFMDSDTLADDIINFTHTNLGLADADNLLETGELVEFRVDVSGYGLTNDDEFTLSVTPPTGSKLVLTRTIPPRIERLMELG